MSNMQNKFLNTPEEIGYIRKGQEIIDDVYDDILKWIQEGHTEIEVAEYIRKRFIELGGEKEAFDTIVAFGSNAAEPHHVPTKRALKKNELVLVDMGVVVKGMCSDFTRTFFFGDEIAESVLRVYNIVKNAQEVGISKVMAGISGMFVDAMVRLEIKRYLLEEYFVHGTGHGVGKEIHQYPRIGKDSMDELQANMVVTIEPGIYFEGEYGIRIEDMVEVGENKRMSRHNTDLIKIVR